MELLLAHGADPDARDRRGATALGHAAATDRVEMVEALLRAGARRVVPRRSALVGFFWGGALGGLALPSSV